MLLTNTYQSSGGRQRLSELGQFDVVVDALNDPEVEVSRGSAPLIKTQIEDHLASQGWAKSVRIDVDRGPTINAFHHSGIALQVQVGNIARAFYDLLKLEAVVRMHKVSMGVLIIPTNCAAKVIGGNLANFERVTSEHQVLYENIVKMPLVIFGFE